MNKYTFFFILNDTLGYEDTDTLEYLVRGEDGYKILNEKCNDKEVIDLPNDLCLTHVSHICYSKLVSKVFDNKMDLYSSYYQSWIWDHQQKKFI